MKHRFCTGELNTNLIHIFAKLQKKLSSSKLFSWNVPDANKGKLTDAPWACDVLLLHCCDCDITGDSCCTATEKNIVGPKKAKLTYTRMMGRNRLWSEALQITCASCHWNWVTTLPRFSQTNHLFTFKHWIKAEGLQWNMNEWLEMYISRLMCSFFIPTLSIGYFRNPYKGKILTETWMNAQRIRQFCFIIWLFVIRSNAQVQSLTWIPLSFMSESSVLVFQQVIQNALTHVQATRHVEEPWGTDETATLPLC